MHHVTLPADPARTLPAGADPCVLVEQWLDERLEEWSRAGLDLGRILFDPGIGFGKNPLQSLKLLRDAARFRSRGVRCLVGHSRKSFMKVLAPSGNTERDLFTLGASLQAVQRLTESEIAAARSQFKPPVPYVPTDPYARLQPGSQLVSFIAESYVRGPRP